MTRDTIRTPGNPGNQPTPRDRAIDELAAALHLPRAEAAGIIDLMVLAAVSEVGARLAEALCEPIAAAASQGTDALKAILQGAHEALGGQS